VSNHAGESTWRIFGGSTLQSPVAESNFTKNHWASRAGEAGQSAELLANP